MFVGIECLEKNGENKLALVNKKWLTPKKSEVFWPPYKTQEKHDKALKKSEELNEDSSTLYTVIRCFFETGESIRKMINLKANNIVSTIIFFQKNTAKQFLK